MSIQKIRSTLLSKPADTRAVRSVQILFTGGVLLFICWFIYFAFFTATLPYQIEYREGAAQVLTHILLQGGNPFSIENQPLGMNNYGIAYNLFVLPLAAAFGNTLFVHRAVTFVFLLLSFLLLCRTIFRLNENMPFAMACGLFAVICLAGRGGLGAVPNAAGTFLFLAGILVPFNRSFDRYGLFLSALFSLIAFYTKPYFVLSFGIVASYLFIFVSKKKGWQYSLLFALLFGFTFMLVRYSSKFYFIDIFVSNLPRSNRSLGHVYEQLLQLGKELCLAVMIGCAALLPGITQLDFRTISFSGLWSRLNLRSLEEPVISRRLDYFAYSLMVSSLAFISILGLNHGNYMTYSYQLMAPPFFLWLFKQVRPQTRLALISMPLLLLNLLSLCQVLLNPVFLRQGDSPEWARLYRYVHSSNDILNSPVIASEMVQLGMQPFDSGHTEFYYSIPPYSRNILLGPNYETVVENGRQYTKAENDKIRNAEYDLIVLSKGHTRLIPQGLLRQYYIKITEITLQMPQAYQTLTVEIWEPMAK